LPTIGTERRWRFSDVITISQRPAVADDRAVPGHREGDLILGTGCGSAIGTLVERSTRFIVVLHLPDDHTADTVATAINEAMNELPAHLRRQPHLGPRQRDGQHQPAAAGPVYFCECRASYYRHQRTQQTAGLLEPVDLRTFRGGSGCLATERVLLRTAPLDVGDEVSERIKWISALVPPWNGRRMAVGVGTYAGKRRHDIVMQMCRAVWYIDFQRHRRGPR
jgi:hypothetical protein